MVNNVLHATYAETYDLNTAVNELSLLAIHTPQAPQLKKMFKGLFENFRKVKILGCNFKMVCASQQSLDPSQMGLEAGQVDPRDVLNPILFKACTGDSLNVLLDRIYSTANWQANVGDGSLGQVIATDGDALAAYYELLADESFRKAHPQAGLTITGLRPFVHKVVTTQPFKWSGVGSQDKGVPRIEDKGGSAVANDVYGFGGPAASELSTIGPNPPTVFLSNGVTEFPSFPTTVARTVDSIEGGSTGDIVSNNGYWLINEIPRVYMGVLVLPPAILQRLFFRLTIVWHLSFSDFRPAYEVGPLNGLDLTGDGEENGIVNNTSTYFNIYHSAVPSRLGKEVSSFSVSDSVQVSKVNEIVK